MSTPIERAKAIFASNHGLLRTGEALKAGVHPQTLYEMRDTGIIEQADRGNS